MESVKNWTRRIFMLTSLNEDQAKEVAEQVVKFIEEDKNFPTLDDSLSERMPDYERKTNKLTLKFVKDSWFSVERFLSYVEIHSKTPRALFSKLQVAEMCHLHEEENDGDDVSIEWQSIDFTDWVNDIRKKYF